MKCKNIAVTGKENFICNGFFFTLQTSQPQTYTRQLILAMETMMACMDS